MKTIKGRLQLNNARWTSHTFRALQGNSITLLALVFWACICGGAVYAADTAPSAAPVESARSKNIELSKREEAVRKEEERLNALKVDIDAKIAEYEKILKQLDAVMAKLKEANSQRMANLVKTYESMPAENAAKDLESSDEELAATILSKMKSRKAGPVLAAMGQRKAAALTDRMSKLLKNLPVK
ncbi:MAG: hypothetical protein HQK98_00635 [Nitrospirae bacterium]|nr:hypothetical protein [Nitrospirota bacterium]